MKTVSGYLTDVLTASTRPGYVVLASCVNTDTQSLWFLLLDQATAPIGGEIPINAVLVPQGTNNTIECTSNSKRQEMGIRCSTGISVCVSTKADEVALPGTELASFTVIYA